MFTLGCFALVYLGLEFEAAAGIGSPDLPSGVINILVSHAYYDGPGGTYFTVEFGLGTPLQNNTLLLDTGSTSLGTIGPQASQCKLPRTPCLGIYDNYTSSTAVFAGKGYNDDLEDHAVGQLFNDTVNVGGGQTFENISFGQIHEEWYMEDKLQNYLGILGMNGPCPDGVCTLDFLQQVVDLNYTSKRAFSLYLGPLNDPNVTGSFIIGGVDRAKSAGPVIVLPMTPDDIRAPLYYPTYTSISVTAVDNTTSNFNISSSPSLSDPVFEYVTENLLGIPPSVARNSSLWPPYAVDCSALDAEEIINVGFAEGTINVPLKKVVQRNGTNGCVLNLLKGQGPFGNPLISNIYATFNVDNKTIVVSNVAYKNEERIEAI